MFLYSLCAFCIVAKFLGEGEEVAELKKLLTLMEEVSQYTIGQTSEWRQIYTQLQDLKHQVTKALEYTDENIPESRQKKFKLKQLQGEMVDLLMDITLKVSKGSPTNDEWKELLVKLEELKQLIVDVEEEEVRKKRRAWLRSLSSADKEEEQRKRMSTVIAQLQIELKGQNFAKPIPEGGIKPQRLVGKWKVTKLEGASQLPAGKWKVDVLDIDSACFIIMTII